MTWGMSVMSPSHKAKLGAAPHTLNRSSWRTGAEAGGSLRDPGQPGQCGEAISEMMILTTKWRVWGADTAHPPLTYAPCAHTRACGHIRNAHSQTEAPCGAFSSLALGFSLLELFNGVDLRNTMFSFFLHCWGSNQYSVSHARRPSFEGVKAAGVLFSLCVRVTRSHQHASPSNTHPRHGSRTGVVQELKFCPQMPGHTRPPCSSSPCLAFNLQEQKECGKGRWKAAR